MRPIIIDIVVDFPDPFGSRNPVTFPGTTLKEKVVNSDDVAETFCESADLNPTEKIYAAQMRTACTQRKNEFILFAGDITLVRCASPPPRRFTSQAFASLTQPSMKQKLMAK